MDSSPPIAIALWSSEPAICSGARGLGDPGLHHCNKLQVNDSQSGNMAYTKISGGGWLMSVLPGLRTKLYEGPDHLLLVEQLVLIERYKRFYFREIQAITQADSARWIVLSGLWGILALFSGSFLLLHQPVATTLGMIFVAIFGFALIHEVVRGPTCIVRLQTPIQSHRIAPLERVRKFRKAMERIEALIQSAQADDPRRVSDGPKSVS
jgi:hypothetical protein